MARYKLTYFDFSGSRGEECRLALHLAGEAFEDDRLVRDTWTARKPTTPYGSVPVLTIEGRGELAQSNAILSYLGRAHDLLPSDPLAAARHEAVMCAVEDFRAQLNPTSRIADAQEKQRAREAFASGYLRTWSAAVERQLLAESAEGPFFGGAQISVADLKLYIAMKSIKSGGIDHVAVTAFDDYPRLTRLYEAVDGHSGVVAWNRRAA
jgi:glutathione S-transferase